VVVFFLGCGGARGGVVKQIRFFFIGVCFLFVASSSSSLLLGSPLLRLLLRGEIASQGTFFVLDDARVPV
jgi:hypothetical protein